MEIRVKMICLVKIRTGKILTIIMDKAIYNAHCHRIVKVRAIRFTVRRACNMIANADKTNRD